MPLLTTRREFLQLAAATTAGAVVFTGCQPPPRELQAQSRVRLAEDVLSAFDNRYASACRQCDAGCGLVVRVVEGRAKKVEGNPDHPLNRGKLCARGQAAVQEQYHPDRIQGPLRRTGERGSGGFAPISWDEALNELVGRLRELLQQGRAGQVAVLTPPLRGHRALVVERFARAYGAQWLALDPLAELPLREAVRRVFGQDALPRFDMQNASYVLSFGADFLGTWLSPVHYGVQYGIFRQGDYDARQFQPRRDRPRGYLVQVEPRLSMTAANADEWLPVRPGREALLALSLAQVILAEGLAEADGARAFGDPRSLDAYQPERVAQETGVAPERIRRVARDFASRRPSLALAGGAAGAHTNGVENLEAALALNLLVGSVGREGGVRFTPPPPIDGLPGARPGSLADWQRLADDLRGGQVQAVLVQGANPLHGLPGALQLGEALPRAPFIASFSSFLDETTALADLVLPSHLPLEDWGDDVPEPGPGLPVLSVQQPVVRPLYDTRSFWDVLLVVADELGGRLRDELPWRTLKEALRDGARALHEQGRGSVQDPDFERFWTKLLQRGGWWEEAATGREGDGAMGRPELGPSFAPSPGRPIAPSQPHFAGPDQDYPFHLVVFEHNTLGAGEAGHLPWLQAAPDPVTSVVWQTWVEVNPGVAARLGLKEGDVVAVESPHGRVEAPVYVHPAANPEVVAIPLGQGHAAYGRWAERRGANPMALLAPLADQATGALAYAATRVRLAKTDRRITLPKFEGTVPAFQLPEMQVLKVVRETGGVKRET